MKNQYSITALSLIVFLSGLILCSCTSKTTGIVNKNKNTQSQINSNNLLQKTSWQLIEFQSMDDETGSVKPKEPSLYKLTLDENGSLKMKLNCKEVQGNWSVTPSKDNTSGSVSFTELNSTKTLCTTPNMEEDILKQMQFIRSYVLKDKKLYLSLMADGGIYVWEKDEQPKVDSIYSHPEKGGPLNWEVTGVTSVLNLREKPSTTAKVIGTYAPKTILDNLGCQKVDEQIWCDVQKLGGGLRGFVSAEFLQPAVSPNGSAIKGPDNSALRAGKEEFDAKGKIPCKQKASQPMSQCEFGVARTGGGYATVVIQRPNSPSRTVFFSMGIAIGSSTSQADGYAEFSKNKKGDLNIINIGEETYEIPDAVVLGG